MTNTWWSVPYAPLRGGGQENEGRVGVGVGEGGGGFLKEVGRG